MANAIVEQLRKARDIMNHGGKHWIKGAEHGYVNPEVHEPGARPTHYYDSIKKNHVVLEDAYCSVGALGEVGAQEEAFIELAKAIDPDKLKAAEEEIEADARLDWEDEEADRKADAANTKTKYVPRSFKEFLEENDWYNWDKHEVLVEAANDVIVGFNDDPKTKWEDVRNAFTKAARRVSQRKG